jgi:dTDP-4-amino-4,6-dideoxygalactose transaminase
MRVKIFDLERDHREIKDELIAIFEEVLSRGEYILGTEVAALEEAFAGYIGVRHAVGVGNGTDAIKIGGLAYGVTRGDKIVTTPNTYVASAMAFSMEGVNPLFCDIEEESLNMDPDQLDLLLKREVGVKLCVPVHLYGHPCKLDDIMVVCRKHGVGVLEDACQAHGALHNGKKVGAVGDVAAFSFYPTKNLGCYGDGGMIVTDRRDVFERAQMLRNYGQTGKHVHVIDGFNSRLDEIQAAMLLHKLPFLDEWNGKRRRIAEWYREGLKETPLILPTEAPWAYHVYHLYVVRCAERAQLMQFLQERHVTTLIHYPTPIHLQGVYERLGHKKGTFPKSEKAASEIISLPMHPSLTDEEVCYVCACVREFYGR